MGIAQSPRQVSHRVRRSGKAVEQDDGRSAPHFGYVEPNAFRVDRVRPGVRADEHAQALFTFRNGGMGTVDVSWSSWLEETSLGAIGSEGSIMVDRSGTVRKRIGDGEIEVIESASSMSINPSGDLGEKDEEGNIHGVDSSAETIQEHFVRCIEEDLEPKTNGPDARGILQTALAIRESARTGKSVDLGD